ncbi:MAG: hypothetical protein IJW36_01905 [Clostridia bacterium]|nr:hypothetical protein [Clostridia bacterium]
MQELIELALKRIDNLERLVEKYFKILKVDNELDFIVKGTYLTDEQVEEIVSGAY